MKHTSLALYMQRLLAAALVTITLLVTYTLAQAEKETTVYGVNQGLRLYETINGYGLMDADEQVLTSDLYSFINPRFHNGYTTFLKDGKLGLMSLDGSVVIDATFTALGQYDEGLLPARTGDEKVGYIDITGKFVIAPQWNGANRFVDGNAVVYSDKVYHIIDKQGSSLLSLDNNGSAYYHPVNINRLGIMFDTVIEDVPHLLLWTPDQQLVDVYEANNGQYELSVDQNDSFQGELLRVCTYDEQGARYGYIDRYGKLVVPPFYYKASSFVNGSAYAYRSHDNVMLHFENKFDPDGIWYEIDSIDKIDRNGKVTDTFPCSFYLSEYQTVGADGQPVDTGDLCATFLPNMTIDGEFYNSDSDLQKATTEVWLPCHRLSKTVTVYEHAVNSKNECATTNIFCYYDLAANRLLFKSKDDTRDLYRRNNVFDGMYPVYNDNGDQLAYMNEAGEMVCGMMPFATYNGTYNILR